MSALGRLRESLFGRSVVPIGEDPKPAPFVVGVGRSGTTLLRLMLDAHPDLAIPPETHFVPQMIRMSRESREDDRETFLKILTTHRAWGDHRMDEAELRDEIASMEPFDTAEALRLFYRLYAKRFEKSRWGDKTPRYIRNMVAIQNLLPEAHFVHLVRDGRDVALSSQEVWFGPSGVAEQAERWKSWIEDARKQSASLDHYMEIRYEDLILDTERVLKKVCGFLDLTWSAAMLDYHERASDRMEELNRDVAATENAPLVKGEDRKRIHALTSRPPQGDRIGRWKTSMKPEDVRRFEEIAGDMLDEFGYERAT